MTPFTTLTGRVASLLLANVDTDVIIRIERLTSGDQDQLGQWAFESIRYDADGVERADFPLTKAAYRGAPFLVAGSNFGCGSSREGAVTAIAGMGIRCLIADSFGDIFYANCFQNGLLPIRVDAVGIARIAAVADANGELTVDLEREAIVLPDGEVIAFAIAAIRREGLLKGLDDIGLSLSELDAIRAWQARDRTDRPWIWELPPGLTAVTELSAKDIPA